jgi:hypothetical protein
MGNNGGTTTSSSRHSKNISTNNNISTRDCVARTKFPHTSEGVSIYLSICYLSIQLFISYL